ncbi:spermidine synthase [Thiocapsa sp.]|uniref:spermidine synthase n=1 Tax=Thiocapsa sp. TaxID=2024551 RepID=UPI002BB0DA16|nr:spermidine synthase [Thiocapsa sp.]HSO83117.1 spermidine synthase [Thiocapsa sp.]
MRAKDKIASIITTLFIWGLAGALFGALFGGLYQVLAFLGLAGWQPLVIAAAAAAMTTSAFYSAMPVALMGAMAGVLASIGYLIVSGQSVELLWIAGTAGAGGVLAGVFYAWMITGGGRPLAETLTGLIAGILAGGIMALVFDALGIRFSMFVLSAGVVALVGTFFQVSERWLVAHSARWFPAVLSAPVVAGLIAAVVGASVWIVGGTTSTLLSSNAQDSANQILSAVPPGFLGGMLGGAVTGVLLQILGFRPEQPH